MDTRSDSYSSDEELGSVQQKTNLYYSAIAEQFIYQPFPYKIVFIPIMHALPSSLGFIRALNKVPNARVGGVIFKSSYRDRATLHKAASEFNILDYNKEMLEQNPYIAVDLINQLCQADNEKCIIIDIGGYFSSCLEALQQSNKLLGIVEDTENGHQKYLKKIQLSSVPIYSVARSELKSTEDYNVGKSIVHAAETILRKKFNYLMEQRKLIAVIGFGKIGRSIATHLRQKGVNVVINDINPMLMLHAKSQGFSITNKEDIFRKADMVFCATGNRSLTSKDLNKFVESEVFIASCTSADDELDLTGLPEPAKRASDKTYNQYKFSEKDSGPVRSVYLLCEGNAVNFHYKAIVGDYLRGVQAALLVAALKIVYHPADSGVKKLHALLPEDETTISRIWLKHFEEIEHGITENLTPSFSDWIPREVERENLFRELNGNDYVSFTNSLSLLQVCGAPGIGKSGLIQQYAEGVKEYYELIWWFDSSNELDSELRRLSNALHIRVNNKNTSQVRKEVLERLRNFPNVLLVFDDADQSTYAFIKEIYQLMQDKPGRKHIIFISREPLADTNFSVKNFHVPAIDKNIAVEWMCKNKNDPSEKQKAIRVYDAFSGQTIALQTAFHYAKNMHEKEFSLFLKNVNESERKYYLLLERIFSKLSPQNQSQLLELSFYDVYGIPSHFLKNSDVASLTEFGLVRVEGSDVKKQYLIHAVTKNHIQTIVINTNTQLWLDKYAEVIDNLNRIFNYDYNAENSNIVENYLYLIRHIVVVLDAPAAAAKGSREEFSTLKVQFDAIIINSETTPFMSNHPILHRLELYNKLAHFYLNEYRNYQAAQNYHLRVLAICQQRDYSSDHNIQFQFHVAKLGFIINQYMLIKSQSDLRHSIELEALLDCIDRCIAFFAEAKDTLMQTEALIMKSYLLKYRASKDKEGQKDIEVATTLLEQAKKCLYTDSVNKSRKENVLKRIGSLIDHAQGNLYCRLERFEEAKDSLQKALIVRKMLLNENHTDVARTKHKLSMVLLKRGDLREARKLCSEALDTQQRFFIKNHSNIQETKTTLSEIEEALKEKGILSQAVKLPIVPDTPVQEPTQPRTVKSFSPVKRALFRDMFAAAEPPRTVVYRPLAEDMRNEDEMDQDEELPPYQENKRQAPGSPEF